MTGGEQLAAILRSAPEGRAGQAGQVGQVEMDLALVDEAVEHGVAPILYRALRDDGRWTELDEAVRARLTQLAHEAVLLESVRSDDLARVIRALQDEGVRPLVFKGAALASTHYPEPWLRARGDSDLLVRTVDAARAGAVLERLGFARLPRPGGLHVTQQARYVGERQAIEVAYDLHWRIADPHAFGNALSYEEIDREGEADPASGARRPSHVHALVIACVHRAAHHYDTPSLILLSDIDRLARGLRDEEWERFAGLAEAKGLRAVCLRGIELASDAFGCAVPDPVRARLADAGAREPTAAYVGGAVRRIDILWSDLKALPGWRARARLLREHLFPPRDYVPRSRYMGRIVRGAAGWFRPL